MPLKHDSPGDEVTVVRRWEGGLTWMAHPDATMRRASHALVVGDSDERSSAGDRTQSDADVWLVDPLDADGIDAELATLGTVAGVVVLTNSHGRHADRLADRHDLAIHVPACFDAPGSHFDAPVETFDAELADTGFELVWETASSGWQEGALYHPDRRTLVVPDTLMTALFTGEDGRLEVLPFFRFSPPQAELGELPVERVLVGHGDPVFENAQTALDEALRGAHRGTLGAIVRSLPTVSRQVYSELRS
jgi:hypothetical protein